MLDCIDIQSQVIALNHLFMAQIAKSEALIVHDVLGHLILVMCLGA